MLQSYAARAATAFRFGQAMARALRDSTRTDELLVGEEISSVGRMQALLPMMAATPSGRRIMSERPILNRRTIDLERLARLPEHTLGHAYATHLKREGLDLEALTTPVTRGRSDEANYLLMRVRQTHDIWHTVLGLGVGGHHEVLVHAFQWPQLRMPYSALVVFFGTIKHVLGERRTSILTQGLTDAVEAGRRAQPLLAVRWEEHLEEPLHRLRTRLSITPAILWRGVPDAILT